MIQIDFKGDLHCQLCWLKIDSKMTSAVMIPQINVKDYESAIILRTFWVKTAKHSMNVYKEGYCPGSFI